MKAPCCHVCVRAPLGGIDRVSPQGVSRHVKSLNHSSLTVRVPAAGKVEKLTRLCVPPVKANEKRLNTNTLTPLTVYTIVPHMLEVVL
jgi:hypothetical protein